MLRTQRKAVWGGLAALLTLALTVLGLMAWPASASPAARPAVGAIAPAHQWPEAHQNSSLTGVSSDPAINTANAGSLGVKWMVYTGGEVLASPVAAWNSALQKTLVYVGNVDGYFVAYDQATGTPVWSVDLGSSIRSTALVEGSNVWIAPGDGGRAYKLNAATGATECSANIENTAETADASPVLATAPGGVPTVYFAENDTGNFNGPVTGIAESNCAVNFSVTPEPGPGVGGIWDFLSYGVDAAGTGLIFLGTADPDGATYAIDAKTGATVWRFQASNPPPAIYDVGAGLTVSPPGVNGFADGVVYFANKDGYMYALDMASGKQIWVYNFGAQTGLSPTGALDTAALAGSTLVFGDDGGIWSLNAVTGAKNWYHSNGAGGVVDGAPAIVGPPSEQVVVESDETGFVTVLSLSTGTKLYSYQTGSFTTGSPAEVSGNILDISGSGFLYDFAPAESGPVAPTTVVTSPTDQSTVTNPNGNLSITGTAASSTGVTGVDVYIQRDGPSGTWWNGASSSWTVAPYPNPATLSASGQPGTSWAYSLPVPAAGGALDVLASAKSSGLSDQTIGSSKPTQAISSFTVSPSSSATRLMPAMSSVAPGATVSVSGSGFAANESVAVTLGATTLATITASSTGTLPATNVMLPGLTPFGPASLYATGATSGDKAVAPIYVTNGWSQSGDNATHQASDLNDHVFERHLSVSSGTYLTPAWSFNAGAPISGSIVVNSTQGYLVDQAGKVFAINTRNGLSNWSYQIPDGTLVDTTPALTPSGRTLLVASTDGSVTALNTVNGSVAWTAQIGGKLEGSASIAATTAYVVSDSGTVTALNTATGKQVWQVTLPSAVQTSPAVNAGSGLVYVADTAGTVYALNATTGATSWSVPSLGTITASLTYGQGNVYAASRNGTVYALNSTSGTTTWTYKDGSAMTAAPADLSGQILVGGADGAIHMLSAANGASTFKFNAGAPIVGFAGAISFDTALLSNGTILGSKPTDSDPRAWETTQGTALSSQPTIVDGEVFVAGENGMVTVYTVPGSPVY